jgi:dextranase
MRSSSLVIALLVSSATCWSQTALISDVFPTKSRYVPGDSVELQVDLDGKIENGDKLTASLYDLGRQVATCLESPLSSGVTRAVLVCSPPAEDFHGYLVVVHLLSNSNENLGERETAFDVASDWKRFPRYGYLAHYKKNDGARPAQWIDELNRFHINGLQFYDFQYRHDQPLAGTVSAPAPSWPDIANREIDKSIIDQFIVQAHHRNMMAMAYNASYSSFADTLTRAKNPLPLNWAVWPDPTTPRTPESVKSLSMPAHWATTKLLYMNQNYGPWQNYLFGQMRDLFTVYNFDGWHIDTFGERSAYAYNGSLVDYIGGMHTFIDHAQAALNKRIVMNAVNTYGQELNARSAADFVYSEFWEGHESLSSIQKMSEQIHNTNPQKSFVIAAYVNRSADGKPGTGGKIEFNSSAVLLADSAIFAAGAAHIELGDGDRMLSSEYFPADTRLLVSPELHAKLRHYYDFMTAYELYLRGDIKSIPLNVRAESYKTSLNAEPGALWTLSRKCGDLTLMHVINLTGLKDSNWRDSTNSRTAPPKLHDVKASVAMDTSIGSVGWASPDVDGGRFHELPFESKLDGTRFQISFSLPSLEYWDMIVLKPSLSDAR